MDFTGRLWTDLQYMWQGKIKSKHWILIINNIQTVYYKVVSWLNTVANNRPTWATVLINYNPLFTLDWMLTYKLLRILVIYSTDDSSYLPVLVWTGWSLNLVLFWWPFILICDNGTLSIEQNQFAYLGFFDGPCCNFLAQMDSPNF